MKKIILLISFILIPVLSIAQDLFIQNNPYDNAEDFVKDRNAFNRERWFNEQRMYPLNYFPENAYGKALDTRNELRNNNGYFMNSSNSWTSIGPTSGSYFSYGNTWRRLQWPCYKMSCRCCVMRLTQALYYKHLCGYIPYYMRQ